MRVSEKAVSENDQRPKTERHLCEVLVAKGLCHKPARHYIKTFWSIPFWTCDRHLKDMQSRTKQVQVIKTLR